MPPPPPAPVRESSYELNQDDELVIVERPPLPERRPQSYISDLLSQNDTCSGRSARSRSPQKGLASGPGLASTPEAETVHPPQQTSTTVTSCTLDRKQNCLAQDTREAAEHKHKDESDDLNIILSHPLHLRLQSELEDARIQRKRLEDDLSEKSSKLAKRESELAERDSELAEARKGWRKVAGELDKIRTKGQGFYQVTDQYLVDKTSSLRYSIRNFAIQYFEGEMKREVQIKASKYLELYIQPTTPDSTAYQELFRSPKRCPSLIQGILWRVLYGTIFDQFQWAGGAGDDVYLLCKTLRPSELSVHCHNLID
jgi:hypothetical protein